MGQVVASGTATILKDLPFSVLAKTGTAQDPAAPNGDTDAWLVAAAPAEDPAIALAVLVRGGGHGGETAGPVVKSALQYFAAHRAVLLGGSAAPAGPPPGSSEHGAPAPCRRCPVNPE
jgi:cell division protein FtsI/penicillin-binding protein 2